MGFIVGIGGIFLQSDDPERLRDWYAKHLGFELDPSYGGLEFAGSARSPGGRQSYTVWSISPTGSDYWKDSKSSTMINYRVDSLDEVMNHLKSLNVRVDEEIEDSEFGKFGWAYDCDGNRFELWEPPISPEKTEFD